MPGREAPQLLPPATRMDSAASAVSTTRRAVPTPVPYNRRLAFSASSSGLTTPSQVPKTASTAPKSGPSSAARSGQTTPALAEVAAPACASCVACYRASEDVAKALTAVLRDAKDLFLDDVLHHYSGDEAWIRVLRSLGWSGEGVEASIAQPSSAASV